MAATSTASVWSESEEKLPKNWNRLEVPKAQFFRIDSFFISQPAALLGTRHHRTSEAHVYMEGENIVQAGNE